MIEKTRQSRLHPARERLTAHFARFRREEDGTLTVFAVYLTILILMLGGVAVDVMRSEQVRTSVQNVEDTAVLAASNLNQSLDAESVVKDYFAKAGMASYLKSVQVTASPNYRKVSAVATTTVPTFFMKLEGINSLSTVNQSTALESIGNVEVALALDNSGSMNQAASYTSSTTCNTSKNGKQHSCHTTYTSISKIDALKDAASQFVDTMFSQVEAGALTISVLPYDSHLDVGNELISDLNVSSETTKAKCIDLMPSDFTTTAVDVLSPMQRSGYFDGWNNSMYYGIQPECNSNPERDSMVFSANATDLKTFINAMSASGNTSIDTGVKWATATLDPSLQPVVTNMIVKGKLGAGYAGLPSAYGDRTHMKVLIVMSDGENTARVQLNPGYYSGQSPVFTNSKDSSNFSYYDPDHTGNQYFWTVDQTWHSKPYGSGGGTYNSCSYSYYYGYTCTTVTADGTATQISYQDLWALMPARYFVENIYAPAYGISVGSYDYNTRSYYNADMQAAWTKFVHVEAPAQEDSNMHNICSAAKANGVLVYSIGFQTTTHGAATLKDCATAASYYFDAEGTDITAVFAKIASSIVHLRLIQ